MGKASYDIKPGTFKYIESEIYNLNENKWYVNIFLDSFHV
ncbi:phage regulatory protein [Staphylococcus aureus]|nr:phage regulatory protein [Staphylococcus aureus]CAC7280546.1 phage regulatory protein [Staphylococcus aureus]